MGPIDSKNQRDRCWEHFTHVADIGVRGFGDTLARAFENTALAMTAVVTDLASVQPTDAVEISCEAPDADFLLADWLNAIVFEMATRKMLFSRFEVAISDHRLTGRAWGETVEVERHRPVTEVKGATLSELAVTRKADGSWCAQCIVDV